MGAPLPASSRLHYPRLVGYRRGLGPHRVRQHPRPVRGFFHRGRAPLEARLGRGLGDRRVLDAPARHRAALLARIVKGKVGGRTQEISRLIGRSLRGIVDMSALGENTIVLDCDVLRADGGTRTAAITGAYVALADAVSWAKEQGILKPSAKVLTDSISAISVGVIDGTPMLDLPYVEDVRAQTDMNVVQTGDGRFIEVQGTAEHAPFNRDELNELLDLATLGNARLAAAQKLALRGLPSWSASRCARERALGLRDLQRAQGQRTRGHLGPRMGGLRGRLRGAHERLRRGFPG